VLDALLADARACRHCTDLPGGPRPILQASATSRLVIASQAPGSIAHASGVPFQDPSGERLRDWLGIGEDVFYDAGRVAILPMGMCYPGRYEKGGDLPPRPECAPRWRARFLALMPEVRLILLVGGYSQADALGPGRMTDRVRAFREQLPRYFPLPHPSWRTGVWERRNPWFTAEVLPALKAEVRRALA
jgi:uracil-DNA glycosylase